MPYKEIQRTSWSVEQRLEFIDYRLFWLGYINRSDLQKNFGISTPQASIDLSRYQDLAPNNIAYDAQGKRYVAGLGYTPKFHEPSARHYLLNLRAVADGAIDPDKSWIGPPQPYSVVPTLRRRLDAKILRSVLEAIRNNLTLNVLYHSLTSGDQTWREIAPHALAFDGTRWHARAWCQTRSEFRDFPLARIHSLVDGGRSPITGQHDVEWHQEVILRLIPNPKLSDSQQHTIAYDYDMENGQLLIPTRISMSYYVEKNLLVDTDTDVLPAERRQLVLANRDEVALAREIAHQETTRRLGAIKSSQNAAE